MNIFKEHAKTIATFFAAYVANALVSLATGGHPWPQSGDEWLQYTLTTLGAATAAFLARNKITQKQLDKDPNVIGGVVVDEKPHEDHVIVNPQTGEVSEIPRPPTGRKSSWRR